MKCYSIHDTAAEYFFPPFFARTDAEASRMFVQSLGDSFPHRSDYGLYLCGAFDQDTGLLTAHEPKIVLSGLSIAESLAPKGPVVGMGRPTPPDTHLANGELIK